MNSGDKRGSECGASTTRTFYCVALFVPAESSVYCAKDVRIYFHVRLNIELVAWFVKLAIGKDENRRLDNQKFALPISLLINKPIK